MMRILFYSISLLYYSSNRTSLHPLLSFGLSQIVIPRSANECDVIYDYFVDQRLADSIDPTELET